MNNNNNTNIKFEIIYEYQDLCNIVEKILKSKNIKNSHLHFSIFSDEEVDSDSENNWFIKCPNLQSKNCVFEGKCRFYNGYNKFLGAKLQESKIYNNPIWSDILYEAARRAKGDHVFLESVDFVKEINNVKYFEFFFGS